MRIRSIKPEFWRSDDIDRLTWHERLVFIGLWSYVDDNGVGLDKLAAICADLFAADVEREPRETFERVAEALSTFAERGLIERYTVEGKAFLYVTGWGRHQRVDKPNRARYPLPTSQDGEPRESSRHPRETVARSSRPEQRNRGTEENSSSKSSSSAKPPKQDEPIREDVEALCLRLQELVVANGNRKPTITEKWRTEARLLLDRDGIELNRAMALIDWCQADPFWKSNVMSMPKFREKYDQLRSKAIEEHNRRTAAASVEGAATAKARGWMDVANEFDGAVTALDPYQQKAIQQ
ncbi:hypothetical protein NDR87_18825 [Nocardia sp. CDC159]|uniref:Uncharacterized protein n=1 Tax=Nocardia pulmonis TaxID=2951408 RepID=A0A9X2E9T3_9NOCA|nr:MULTISPECIES: hypothetical protein [Nocardia]MCM6776255.1 hypothetical protein [Nocardia pulmonis]MCM6788419.1 hypothetical protein [Nocardia sp. CDC159]